MLGGGTNHRYLSGTRPCVVKIVQVVLPWEEWNPFVCGRVPEATEKPIPGRRTTRVSTNRRFFEADCGDGVRHGTDQLAIHDACLTA